MHEQEVNAEQHHTTISVPTLDHFTKKLSHYLPFLDLSNPLVVLVLAYGSKKALDYFSSVTSSVTESLWFSQQKDIEINQTLQLLRETIGCSRLVLGLIVNGETAIGQNYHLRKLVLTHEDCAAGISSILKNRISRYPLSVLDTEVKLYGKESDWVAASIVNESLNPNCRRYLDAIECHTLVTFRLLVKIKGKEIELGYLSFQWDKQPNLLTTNRSMLNEIIENKLGKDLTYYLNRLITTIEENSDRRSFFTSFGSTLVKLFQR